jgi:MFS family permease
LIYPILLFVFAFLRWIPLSLLFLAGVGLGTIFVLNLANALVPTSTPDHLRGRVMGAYTWIFFGFMPLGALWIGTVAQHLGVAVAVVINASIAFVLAVSVFLLFPKLREQ